MRSFLRPGGWNEVVGVRWIFIFEDGLIEWDSVETEQRILEEVKSSAAQDHLCPYLDGNAVGL